MSLTQKHVQNAIVQNAVDAVFNQMAAQQAAAAIQSSGQNMMPLTLGNGSYNSGGTWTGYLLCDVTPINEGVLR